MGAHRPHIFVDARFLSAAPYSSHARYLRELVRYWSELVDGPRFTLFGPGPQPTGVPFGPSLVWRSAGPLGRLGRRAAGGRVWLNAVFAPRSALARPDVLFFPYPYVPSWLAAPTVVTVHDVCFRTTRDAFAEGGRALDRRVGAALRAASAIVAVSRACRDGAVAEYGTDPKEIEIVHHGLAPIFRAAPWPDDAAMRTRLGVTDPYILCVSTHERRKNLTTLVHAFAALRAERPEQRPTLVLVGRSTPYTKELEALRPGDAPEEPRVRFLESTGDSELAALYRGAVAVALPSLCEGFGFPLIESLASGTPVVASDLPVFRELAETGVRFVPPLEVPRWTAELGAVLRTSPADRLSTAAADAVVARYTWRDAAGRTLRVLEDAARRGRHQPVAIPSGM